MFLLCKTQPCLGPGARSQWWERRAPPDRTSVPARARLPPTQAVPCSPGQQRDSRKQEHSWGSRYSPPPQEKTAPHGTTQRRAKDVSQRKLSRESTNVSSANDPGAGMSKCQCGSSHSPLELPHDRSLPRCVHRALAAAPHQQNPPPTSLSLPTATGR